MTGAGKMRVPEKGKGSLCIMVDKILKDESVWGFTTEIDFADTIKLNKFRKKEYLGESAHSHRRGSEREVYVRRILNRSKRRYGR